MRFLTNMSCTRTGSREVERHKGDIYADFISKPAQHALKYAAKAAREMKHPYIGTEHLLLALREEYTGVAGQVLANSGVESEEDPEADG